MRIGFDVSQTGRHKAGCGYYAYNLIRHLAELDDTNEYVLYPAVGDVYWDPECDTETFQTDRADFRRVPAPKTFEQSQEFWRNPPADFEHRLGNPDIFHSNNFFCPTGLRHARLVYTLYDLSFLEEPAWTTEANRIGCFSGVFQASLYADAILAISEFTRRHFLQVFPHYPAERTFVVYPASRFDGPVETTCPPRMERLEPGRFWLNVATVEPRKNHGTLLEAYARLLGQLPQSMPLVLAGARGWLSGDFEQTIDRLGLRDHVVITGYVTDEELHWLYQNCFAFIYPSFFEGFGLPVLEAMSVGAPVISSDATSLPEVTGDAALLADPLDVGALAQHMTRLVLEPSIREVLRRRGLERARAFSWRRSAALLLEIYRQVITWAPRALGQHIERGRDQGVAPPSRG